MRVLVVGAGGVGAAFAAIAQRREVFERVVLADVALERAQAAAERLAEPDRFAAERVDASIREELVALIERVRPDAVLNACDPRFNEPIFGAAFDARVTYLDMAMTLSHPHPERPYEQSGEMLGDRQLAEHERWQSAGLLALVGIGVEPGLSDVFARYAAAEVLEAYAFPPPLSLGTPIEESLPPPLIWERERGFYTTAPFSEPEVFEFPEGIGPVECVNVEHEEVVLIPRWVKWERVTFKYGLGQEFIDVLSTLHKLGLDSTEPVSVRGVQVAPRDVVAAALPDPATLGERMSGRTCAGTWVTGTGKDGQPRSPYLYHVVDNETTMREYSSQAVVWQTAVNPAVALELLDRGDWKGAGVLGPEAFAPKPFLELLAEYGSPHGQVEVPQV